MCRICFGVIRYNSDCLGILMQDRERWLNSFAISSFRDTGDSDYIAARMAYRARLMQPFLWASLQALEKYLKCILVLNRVSSKGIGHDLAKALDVARAGLNFSLKLRESTHSFIEYIDTFGRFRYLETPFFVEPYAVFCLDCAVWDIRRYCQVLNCEIGGGGAASKNAMDREISRIEAAALAPPQDFKISGGLLEKILATRSHPARSALIWQNPTFGDRRRNKVHLIPFEQAVNSPLSMQPEMLEYALQYVQLQSDVKDAYRTEITQNNNRQ